MPAGAGGAALHWGVRGFRIAGRVFVVTGAVLDGISIAVAHRPWRRSLQVVSAWAAAGVGATQLGRVGAAIGTFVEPGGGTAIGGGVGAVLGGFIGYISASCCRLPIRLLSWNGVRPSACGGGAVTMKAGIEIVDYQGEARGIEAARLISVHTVCAFVDRPLPADGSEETVDLDVVTALSLALAACGNVAFRYDNPLSGAAIFQPPPTRPIKDRLLDLAGLGDENFGLVVASEPSTIGALFAYGGWSYAAQCAVVFDPAADPAPVLHALRCGLDWRERKLPVGARLLFGPGHDGDFAIVAATDAAWLEHFKAALI